MTYPISVAATADGTVYVADLKLPGIWKSKDGSLEVYFQGSNQFGTPLNGVRCLAVDKDGKLLAGDSATREVYRFDNEGKPQPLTKGGIGMPQGIAVGEDGTLFVSDLETHTIYKVPAAGGTATAFARVKGPLGMVMDGDKNLVVVTRQGKLMKVNGEGKAESFGEGGYKFAPEAKSTSAIPSIHSGSKARRPSSFASSKHSAGKSPTGSSSPAETWATPAPSARL